MILMFLKIIETLKISFEMKLWTLFFLVPSLTIWSVLQTEFRPICKKCQNTQFTQSPEKQSNLRYIVFVVSQKHFLDLEYALSFIDLAK